MDHFGLFDSDMWGVWIPLFLILAVVSFVWAKRPSRRSAKMVVPSAPIPPVASDEPAVKRMQVVRFAGRWYECQPINEDTKMGLGMVQLTDRRTHSRPIIRPLFEIRRA